MPEITTLTTFTIAAGEVFPPEPRHSIPEQWKMVFTPLARDLGYRGGVVGRSVEHPEKCMIFAGWKDAEHLAAFSSSAEGQSYEFELAERSQSTPYRIQVEFFRMYMVVRQNGLWGGRSELHTIDFPKGHRESIAEGLSDVKGMACTAHLCGVDGSRPEILDKRDDKGSPLSGWVVRHPPGDKCDVDQAIWIHSWKSPERERRFKDTEVRTMTGLWPGVVGDKDGIEERSWAIEEYFEERLRRLGALGIRKEYFEFQRFPRVEV